MRVIMITTQYKVLKIIEVDTLEADLNTLSRQGWRVVGTLTDIIILERDSELKKVQVGLDQRYRVG